MDSFDSFCFPPLDGSAEKSCVSEETAFVDSLLLPTYLQSPSSSVQMQASNNVAPQVTNMQQCAVSNSNSSVWPPAHACFHKQEVSMAAMYSMMMNMHSNSNTHSASSVNASDAPATIMNMLSMTNSSMFNALPTASSISASMQREDSNCSMVELDREYDTASTVSPFSTSDGALSSDEYPTPNISPLSQSRAAPTQGIQTHIKLESGINNFGVVSSSSTSSPAAAAPGSDEQFSIEIITPPSTVLENRRMNATTTSAASAKKRGSPAISAQKKKECTPPSLCINNKADEMKVSQVSPSSQKSKKRACKSESSDDSDSDQSDDEEQSSRHESGKRFSSSSTGADSKVRLARKAELARMSRRRKKMRLNDLEKEVKRLQEELEQLQNEAKARQINTNTPVQAQEATVAMPTSNPTASTMHASPGNSCVSSPACDDDPAYQQLMALMSEFVSAAKGGESSSDGVAAPSASVLLDLFVSRHAAFLRSGSSHLNALNQHVQAILPFQFLNWMCTQTDSFYADPSGLWRSLFVDELHLTANQLNDMDTFRHTVRKQYKHVLEIQKLFKRMSEAMNKQSVFSLQNMERIRTVLTPQQFAHYIDWVQKFGEICLKMHQ